MLILFILNYYFILIQVSPRIYKYIVQVFQWNDLTFGAMSIIIRKDTEGRRRLRDVCLGGVICFWICKRYFVRRLTREELPYSWSHFGYRTCTGCIKMHVQRVSWYSGIYWVIKYCNTVSKMHEYLEIKIFIYNIFLF